MVFMANLRRTERFVTNTACKLFWACTNGGVALLYSAGREQHLTTTS